STVKAFGVLLVNFPRNARSEILLMSSLWSTYSCSSDSLIGIPYNPVLVTVPSATSKLSWIWPDVRMQPEARIPIPRPRISQRSDFIVSASCLGLEVVLKARGDVAELARRIVGDHEVELAPDMDRDLLVHREAHPEAEVPREVAQLFIGPLELGASDADVRIELESRRQGVREKEIRADRLSIPALA